MAIRRAKQKEQVIAKLSSVAPPGETFLACVHCETGPSPWLNSLFDEVPILGLVMALPGIPGQGILTMIVGLTMLDFPGKRGLERRLIGRPHILHALNRLRARFGRAPLEMS